MKLNSPSSIDLNNTLKGGSQEVIPFSQNSTWNRAFRFPLPEIMTYKYNDIIVLYIIKNVRNISRMAT